MIKNLITSIIKLVMITDQGPNIRCKDRNSISWITKISNRKPRILSLAYMTSCFVVPSRNIAHACVPIAAAAIISSSTLVGLESGSVISERIWPVIHKRVIHSKEVGNTCLRSKWMKCMLSGYINEMKWNK